MLTLKTFREVTADLSDDTELRSGGGECDVLVLFKDRSLGVDDGSFGSGCDNDFEAGGGKYLLVPQHGTDGG